ncbi:TPA: DUF2283 domain-containing protein [Candidatus Woesearchaeota archaeon]|nr:DUF2283 domain-containing protein [Candidatus Woesearchaeota archaeon]
MKIEYDPDADALYIEFTDAEFARNRVIDHQTIIDLDKGENIIGIELLNVSKRIPKDFMKSVKVKNISLEQ